ncbi:bifunctional UDP-N-acetylglucosamine diphosphorylase/glucosamine-1-phosphate N-acetyltransferase GlmU [Roseivivax sp. CAU 1753]
MSIALVILAAGKGTRMESDLPKVLHKIGGAPMLHHAMQAGASLEPERVVVVAGHGADLVTQAAHDFDPDTTVVLQNEQKGTAHAVAQAAEALADFDGDVMVLYGDTPFISRETLEQMSVARADHDIVVLGFTAADPGRYGRLVMRGDTLDRIVEFKDASEAELAIDFCNSGVLAADRATLFDLIAKVGNANASGEYYLPDVVGLGRAEGLSATAVGCDESETLGINSRTELAAAEAAFQTLARRRMIADGVTMQAPDTVFLSLDTHVGRDSEIEPNVVFGPGVTVESGARIRAFSHLEGAHVSRGAVVGPYARLRPGTELAENVRVGNFVEVKNTYMAEGSKANHLTYLGDADIGEGTNIGAGTVTCNYDGYFKHRTVIGARSFIGSSTMLVAPLTLGVETLTGSGSVITQDVPDGALALGRARQETKPGYARKLFDMLKSKKNSARKGV